MQHVAVSAPTVEHHVEPFGIGEGRPRLSFIVTGPDAWRQASVSIEVRIARLGEATVHRIEGDDSVLLDWPAATLRSRDVAEVRVRVHGEDGGESAWSPTTRIEAGLLRPEDWQAHPVGADWEEDRDSDDRRPSLVRRTFQLDALPVSARLYASAHGLYEAELNGERVGDDALAPGWTVYRERLRYATYDVTALLRRGENAIGAWLGDGWYRGRLGWRGGFRNISGHDLSFIGQLELRFEDGSTTVIATDGAWTAAPSPIIRAGNYDGEDYDAREELEGWSSPGFDAGEWSPVAVRHRDPATLVAPTGPPVRCTEELHPIAVLTTPSGARVLDFGQNVVGRVRIRVRGERGRVVTLRTAEVLEHGELGTRPLRGARSADSYTLRGGTAGEEWEPRFTFHGFRYVEVDGWPGDLDEAASTGGLVARIYHTDMPRTGWFESSDASLDQLHRNVVWGMRGNFVDIPTDCPQRDERVGWTGDIQVFAPTASFLFDCSGMLTSWLRDLAVEQLPDGTVPWYVPVIPSHHMWTPIRPGAAWGDAAVLTPWALYEAYGDRGLLHDQFASSAGWVDLLERLAGDDRLWRQGFQLGDWLDPDAPPHDPAEAKTDPYLVATAYFARSTQVLARICEVTGRQREAVHYRRLAEEVAEAFRAAYVPHPSRMSSDAQTAYALAIRFDLLPDEPARRAAGARLAELVRENGNRIGTGFVGTPLVNDALAQTGQLEAAYDLLLERERPSWLYAVDLGATTVWERWDSMLPDGSINPGQMTSFNHYALGAVADWMHRTVAGLAPEQAGYRRIRFAPRPGGGLDWARAEHRTPYGTASISWRIEEGELQVETLVPHGTTAVLDLDGHTPIELGPGAHRHAVPAV